MPMIRGSVAPADKGALDKLVAEPAEREDCREHKEELQGRVNRDIASD